MDNSEFEARVKNLLDRAMQVPPEERFAFVRAWQGDDAVKQKVLSALAAMSTAGAARSVSGRSEVSRRIGRYVIQGEVGGGGMGKIYLGVNEDDQPRVRVAIKLLRVELDTESDRRRFEQERQVLSGLSHEYIARLKDAGTAQDGRPFIALEYVEGMPIDKFCDVQQYSVEERLRLFLKVCDAVDYAHKQLVAHRDLKPSNILVTPAGVPKLLDFGIAKLLNSELMGVPFVTRTGRSFMTPEYASPEQVNDEPVGIPSDVYSLGVVLYELLTGRLPYQSLQRREIIEELRSATDPRRPSTRVATTEMLNRDDGTEATWDAIVLAKVRQCEPGQLKRRLEGDLDNILLQALRHAPRHRYASVEALAKDIRSHLDGMPVTASPATWSYKASKFVRRHRGGVATAVVLGLVVIAAVVAMGYSARAASVARDAAEAATLKAKEGEARARSFADQEKAQRERADRLVDASMELVVGMARGMESQIRRLDESTDAGAIVVQTLAPLVERLANETPRSDVRARQALARSRLVIGDVLGGVGAQGQGRFEAARLQYEASGKELASLSADAPNDVFLRIDKLQAEMALTNLLLQGGYRAEALARSKSTLEEAREIAKPLAAPAATRMTQAAALNGLASALSFEVASADEAVGLFRESIGIYRRCIAEEPESLPLLRAKSVAIERLAALVSKRNPGESTDLCREALADRERILRVYESPRARRDVLIAREKLQMNLWSVDSAARPAVIDAMSALEKDFQAERERDQSDTRLARDHARIRRQLASFLLASGDHERAADAARGAIAVLDSIEGRVREDANSATEYAYAKAALGRALGMGPDGDRSTGIRHIQDAIDRAKKILEVSGSDAIRDFITRAEADLAKLRETP